MKNRNTISDQIIFEQFVAQEQLSSDTAELFGQYLYDLLDWNKRINLTAITDVAGVLNYHFQDSLRAGEYIDFKNIKMIADVGAGAGFPGIPLKLIFPHLSLVIIEVNHKKIQFLRAMIETLSLKNVEIYSSDWRTFLRKTAYPIELFCARASLAPSELIRIFKSSCVYNNAELVYWASAQWQPTKKEEPFIYKEIDYQIKNKKRKFIFLRRQNTM